MIIFKYRPERYGNKSDVIWRPIADVFFKGLKGDWFELHPYIDSGADVTMIPLSFGKLLGLSLDKKKIEQIGGIRGSVPVVYVNLPIKIGDEELAVKVGWALIETLPPLLGRTDIFDKYTVAFKQRERVIEFKERYGVTPIF